MKSIWIAATTALMALAAVASAGQYSGPTDTEHAIDPAIPANAPDFVEWADLILPIGSGTYFAPRGSRVVSPAAFNSLGDLDEAEIARGDSPGYVTVSFPTGIGNGPGADFAVFENGFTFGSPNGLFLELAYVEVSTNGSEFARFPSVSTNVAPVTGSGAFAGYDTSNVFNLAGKHASGYGTPFDLEDLAEDPLVHSGTLNLDRIEYVRLIDIPGNGLFLDSEGHPILDNWMTTGSGGFDFRLPEGQGIGVLHAAITGLAADFNGSGAIDAADIDLLSAAIRIGTDDSVYDLDASGTVDQADLSQLIASILNTGFGDANLDLEFNSSDMVQVFQAGKYETGEDAGWLEGDWNGDGVFNSRDMVVAFTDGHYEIGPRETAVLPEPSSTTLIMFGFLFIANRRRRRPSMSRLIKGREKNPIRTVNASRQGHARG